jgi:hypothetical protein
LPYREFPGLRFRSLPAVTPSAIHVPPYSNVVPGRGWNKERQRKKEMKSRRRSSLYMTESTKIDHRQKLKEVGIDDEDKELIDEGTMSDI